MSNINDLVAYFGPNGTPTDEGLKYFKQLEAKLQAISEITPPTGGATQDAEARAAISAIISELR